MSSFLLAVVLLVISGLLVTVTASTAPAVNRLAPTGRSGMLAPSPAPRCRGPPAGDCAPEPSPDDEVSAPSSGPAHAPVVRAPSPLLKCPDSCTTPRCSGGSTEIHKHREISL